MTTREVLGVLITKTFGASATSERPERWSQVSGNWYKLDNTFIVVFEDDFPECHGQHLHGPSIGIFENDTKRTIQPCDTIRLIQYLCFDYSRPNRN